MFDVAVIGGGPGGYRTAELLGKQGMKVALIEEKMIGGVCLNQGCIPFKSYLNATKILQEVKKLSSEKITDEVDVTLNQRQILRKKQQIVAGLRKSVENTLKFNGVSIFYGYAQITENNEKTIKISIEDEVIECGKLVIATGSEEIMLPGITDALSYKVIGSCEMLELDEFPQNIDIIGGGVIGLEAACYYADAGCQVTLIEATDHIGGSIDLELSTALKRILQKKGICVYTDTCLTDFEQDSVLYRQNGEYIRRTPQYVLIAIGRKPRLDEKMLSQLNVEFRKNGIIVDEQCRTSNPNVYACGDVTGKMMLAHTAYRQAKMIADSIQNKNGDIAYHLIPRVIYTNPEVLSIGFSEEHCKKENIGYIAKSLPMTYSGKYFAENGKDGAKAKMIVDDAEHRIIGFHMIGNGASELSLAMELMISNKMTIDEIQNIVIAHPTYGEIIGELAGCF